ncbi:T7SS effector LXG polymorphic toxin [Virgibacillus sp. FSP13]
MGNKVDISEVNELSDDLKTTSEKIKLDLDHIKADIDQIIAMETFSGKTAKQAKGYFGDLHKTILDAFNGLFTDLNDNLKQHLDLFESDVDSSKTAIIESDYLTDTEMDVDEKYEELNFEHQVINRTISSVADITSATTPNFSPVTNDENEVIEEITDLEDKFTSFTNEGKEHDSETKELLHHIEVAMNRAGRSMGEARFADYKSKSTEVGLGALKDYNEGKRKEEIQKARKAKNDVIKDLNEPSQAILNNAYTDLKNGEIDSDRYYQIISVLNKTKGDLSEEELNEEVPEGFVEYLNENRAQIARDLSVPIGASILEYKGTVKLGALIQRFKAIPGPAGPNSFSIVNAKSASAARPFFKADSYVRTAGRAIGKGFIGLGFGVGMYNDIANNDKTWGEATTHNVVATGIGIGATVVAKGIITAGAVALGATPVGWAAVGIAAGATAVGVVATSVFNFAYEHNFLGLQDGLDWAGQQIEDGWNTVTETATNLVEDAGEAIQSGLDAINPFS